MFYLSLQICLTLHNMHDDHMAVLFYHSRQRVRNTTQLHTWIFDNDIINCHLYNIHKFLSNIYDDVFRCICTSVYSHMFIMALLCWIIIKYSRKLLNMCHLYHLYLHSHSTTTIFVLHCSFNIFNII